MTSPSTTPAPSHGTGARARPAPRRPARPTRTRPLPRCPTTPPVSEDQRETQQLGSAEDVRAALAPPAAPDTGEEQPTSVIVGGPAAE
ncbi:hypothetical protein, partial [Blastococcus sp. CCUG 61487]|uniref:hypothetical protein n=1 Tax=Blastococcus sp. CCUG 61487 TaxID=1840703 RepID=UPI001BAEF749